MRQFAASGSCMADEKIIYGNVVGCTFKSNEFTGSLTDDNFWKRLKEFANNSKKFIILAY